ncbi:MAG: HD family phosphohydrolase [bacterium]
MFAKDKKKRILPEVSSPKNGYKKGVKREPFYAQYSFQVLSLLIVTTIILALIITPHFKVPYLFALKEGDISPKDIKANFDFSVEDNATTIKRQEEAEETIHPVYDFDNDLYSTLSEKLDGIFTSMKEFYKKKSEFTKGTKFKEEKDAASLEGESQDKEIHNDLIRNEKGEIDWGEEWNEFRNQADKGIMDIPYSMYLVFEENEFLPQIETLSKDILKQILKRGIFANTSFTLNEQERGFVKRSLSINKESVQKVADVFTLEEAKEFIRVSVNNYFSHNPRLSFTISALLENIVTPNLILNLRETTQRKEMARKNVKPVYFQLKKGEMIIREGEKIKPQQIIKLEVMKNMGEKTHIIEAICTLSIIITIVLIALYILLIQLNLHKVLKIQNLLLLSIIMVTVLLVCRIGIYIANALPSNIPTIPLHSYYYALPFAAASILVCLALNVKAGVIVSVVMAIFAAQLVNNELSFFLLTFFGGIGACYILGSGQDRSSIMRAGLFVGLVNLIILIPLDMQKGILFTAEAFFDALFCILGGLMVATLALFLIPTLESLFKLPTAAKLLELLNLNQPLLRELAIEAPGTYHHSIIVANLAEAACEAVNANSLLARVAAHYHDIGKIQKPRYYVENQMDFKNEHEKLSPNMSSLILVSHVKDGVELAKREDLCPAIIDIIHQHHGTSLIRFFFMKAKEMEEKDLQDVKEEDFRYPGPRPQTKEAGIIMLADAVEAASRSLTDPRPSRIQGLISTIINNIFKDGQLDECELTLKELHQIARSFNQILLGIFHPRIAYPGVDQKEKEGKKEVSGDPNKKLSKKGKDKQTEDTEDSEYDLRRLGIVSASNQGSKSNIRKR